MQIAISPIRAQALKTCADELRYRLLLKPEEACVARVVPIAHSGPDELAHVAPIAHPW